MTFNMRSDVCYDLSLSMESKVVLSRQVVAKAGATCALANFSSSGKAPLVANESQGQHYSTLFDGLHQQLLRLDISIVKSSLSICQLSYSHIRHLLTASFATFQESRGLR